MKLYNHQTKNIEECQFDTIKPVTIYTCGPTVYDYPHIGNWYTFIRYDMLVRTLRIHGINVRWVMNITDVGHLVSDADSGEDKIEKGAKREGKTAWDVAKYYSEYFVKGLGQLNFSNITDLPKATDYIKEQIDLVKILEEKGYTYKISDGIYFNTSKFLNYSKFAQLDIAGQEEGARVESNGEKINTSDFALWKFSPINEQRDMEWDSPWGRGFPGWHLDCSAMIHALLGQPIDIHAGGVDHIPVHHTNEVAQSEAAYGVPLSRYWMHCNHIQVNGQKMSKSLGNFYTLEDILEKQYSEIVFRLHVLSGHYRSQSEFNWDTLESTKNRLQNWIDRISHLSQQNVADNSIGVEEAKSQLLAALGQDLNSPLCLSHIDEQTALIKQSDIQEYVSLIDDLLGIKIHTYLDALKEEQRNIFDSRKVARENNDWAKSDILRDDLDSLGIRVKDTPAGQVWSRTV